MYNLCVFGGIFLFPPSLLEYILLENNKIPDKKPRFAASDLVRHCLPMFHKNWN